MKKAYAVVRFDNRYMENDFNKKIQVDMVVFDKAKAEKEVKELIKIHDDDWASMSFFVVETEVAMPRKKTKPSV